MKRWTTLILGITLACSNVSSQMVKTWREPTYAGRELKNVLVIALTPVAKNQQTFEYAICDQLVKSGRKPFPASDVLPKGQMATEEAIAAFVVAIALFAASAGIAINSIREITSPHHAPAPFTLVVLALVVLVKETLFRFVFRTGENVTSTAVKADAWHHRSDALTSLAAFIGISIALIGGKGYESADDWAALVAAAVILVNAYLLVRPALSELTDASPDSAIAQQIRTVAAGVADVKGTHRCWVRKTGFDYFVELDVLVDGSTTVREGHNIAHNVMDAVRDAMPFVTRVVVHIEPSDEYGRYKLEWER
jgi:cation diffusion facilitator family transporter